MPFFTTIDHFSVLFTNFHLILSPIFTIFHLFHFLSFRSHLFLPIRFTTHLQTPKPPTGGSPAKTLKYTPTYRWLPTEPTYRWLPKTRPT